ncbi:hypothetical protein Ae168Ps1_3991c [Pseudonocardia sp. Ae168_Ps1]|uniref:hypothetical protein n=1 Tax=unclassified Pseudonocardia TaxID=2619320 RepID=UPI00094AC3EA|nr:MULTISPECIES: hypothetical protein [unclassified Pseudonocardia]OLL75590.1 hypothetical protein Ae150APs1_3968c [Pseudonocardia sp. Ae150A_Ps1]OLL81585.1 hypothetical protein Ae168Ps1_3991c [Pseudonocardia sp. Ae168_Ps1]OLL84302.1 hypothetical protein Ae263Ps1_1357 [Pseudonocardia sp. Ae263_Ps1]OLL95680.1 hypothetical protein Ae356Ps1_5577c [Pseudonocardia sp. Ae356_Ps1]
MDRLTRAMARAQRGVDSSKRHLDEVVGLVDQALAVAAQVHNRYVIAPDKIRRRINQGFFHKLWIDEEGASPATS